jgi:hypothetical protein
MGLLLAAGLLAMVPGAARASNSAGIELDVGRFKLRVYYNVALEYCDSSDLAIRDPRAALFELVALLQANAEAFSAIDHALLLELTMREGVPGTFLEVREDPSTRDIVLWDGRVSREVVPEMLKKICDRYAVACARPSLAQITLYPCKGSGCPGQIRFGSFPSASANRAFALLAPKGEAVKGVVVTRTQVLGYFEEL